jgi:hypothetical protein
MAAGDPVRNLWLLNGYWAGLVIAVFVVSRFKLPHYAFPAFPALACLAAGGWHAAACGRPRVRPVLTATAVLFGVLAAVIFAVMHGAAVPTVAIEAADVTARSASAQGRSLGPVATGAGPLLPRMGLVFGLAAVALGFAASRTALLLGRLTAVGATAAFLMIAGQGLQSFAESRSAARIGDALARRLEPGDVVVHEGPIENSASVLLRLPAPVPVVDGLQSNVAFGATFSDSRRLVWDRSRLRAVWQSVPVYLVSVVPVERSVTRELAPITLVTEHAGRRLYTNVRTPVERKGRHE